MEDSFSEQYVKQSHISVIHLIQEKMEIEQTDFDELWELSEVKLAEIRDDLIKKYNDFVNSKKSS